MSNLDYTTIDIGLPSVPDIGDPKMFQEFVRVYNAIKILAQTIDTYTSDGSTASDLTATKEILNSAIDMSASLAELTKQYRRYTVPTFTVKGAFGCNGKSPHLAIPITKDATTDTIAAVAELQNILKQFGLAS